MSRTVKHPYTKSKAIDKTCRCHGGCPYCTSNRLIHTLKEEERVNFKSELEHQIHMSDDALELIYPEKLEYLFKSVDYDE